MNGACNGNCLGPPPGKGSTGHISKIFIPNFVCVLTNERNKTYQTGFLFCCLGHALGVGLGGA